MLDVFHKRISTSLGIIIIIIIGFFVGAAIIREYQKIMEMHFKVFESTGKEKPTEQLL